MLDYFFDRDLPFPVKFCIYDVNSNYQLNLEHYLKTVGSEVVK